MLRPRLPRVALNLRRAIHRVAPLEHFENGIDGLFTADGFRLAYTDYQGLMLEKINAITAGAPEDYSSTTKNLLIKYARQPSMASLFNHASMAHNNHFFFSCLANSKQEMPTNLTKNVEDSFTSVETLKRDFIATANAMFGPGFVWLVKTDDGIDRKRLALLTTYIAGSPYPGAHFRRQERDLNTEMDLASPAEASRLKALANMPVANAIGTHGPRSTPKNAPGGIGVIPLLCVNTWEHVYLADWGILGKKQFLEAWWDRVDWNVIANRMAESADKSRF